VETALIDCEEIFAGTFTYNREEVLVHNSLNDINTAFSVQSYWCGYY